MRLDFKVSPQSPLEPKGQLSGLTENVFEDPTSQTTDSSSIATEAKEAPSAGF